MQFPKSKILRLFINIGLIVGWLYTYFYIDGQLLWESKFLYNITGLININNTLIVPFIILLIPIFFITRYIWFEKSRNRIFYGLFDKFKKLKKFLEILNINLVNKLKKRNIDYFWQKIYKDLQTSKNISNKKKEKLLIQLNNPKDELNEIDIESLKKLQKKYSDLKDQRHNN